jgi:hypothetical protein
MDTDLPVMWFHPDLLASVVKSQNNGIKVGERDSLKSQALKFTNFKTTVHLKLT